MMWLAVEDGVSRKREFLTVAFNNVDPNHHVIESASTLTHELQHHYRDHRNGVCSKAKATPWEYLGFEESEGPVDGVRIERIC